MPLHLIKLCVGVDTVEELESFRDLRVAERTARGEPAVSRHVTRMSPKRAEEVLDGGSLYWVIKRVIQCRQRIIGLDEVIDAEGTKRCVIVMDPEIIRTNPSPKRPFQGWRYLKDSDAPADLTAATGGTDLPDELRRKLIEIGAW
ncbi:MAG: DUF1489 family protein [Alphaproteobacteria bacterium]|nr:DUF1489 family protein [Alphaproteobacteria bacterium]